MFNKKERYKINLEGIQYDIIDTSSFMLHAIFSQYFLLKKIFYFFYSLQNLIITIIFHFYQQSFVDMTALWYKFWFFIQHIYVI